ncbi:cyclic nucleotide-binding domain-containing protein [Holophaga foetida]|uniref:cyclic nucleotide-binding domain-containing protein n=1 Tax=Holophaga foetida TaxID=35839 RepID=UPI0002473AFA|nr:cyclic nucleotide-binding domain-containing protein [Holophaga foetida]
MPDTFDVSHFNLDEGTELPALLSQCPDIEPRVYRDGEYLMREGEESQELFIVLDGAYVVARAPEVRRAQPTILATVTVDPCLPSIVGEMAYFGTQRRSASVRSSGRTLALCLKQHHIEVIVEQFPALLRIIFRQLAQRLIETNDNLKDLQSRFSLAPEKRMADAGDVLFSAGEPADKLFQLVMGEVRLEGEEGSRLVRPDDLPHGLLELEAYLRKRPHRVSATVEGMAFVLVVDADRREAVVRSYPQLALGLL